MDHTAKAKKPTLITVPVKIVVTTAVTYLITLMAGYLAMASLGPIPSATITAAGIIATLLAGLISVYYYLNRPLKRLLATMRQVRQGNFLARAKVRADDEIGELARDLNYLLDNLTAVETEKLETEYDLIISQNEVKLKNELQKKNKIIEKTNDRLKHLVDNLSLVYEVGQNVNSTIDLEELYRVISDLFEQKLNLHEFAILLREDEALRVKVARGFKSPKHILDMTFRLGEGISGLVAQTGETVYVPDTRKDSRYLYYRGGKEEDGSFLSVPLKYKKEVLGVVNFGRPAIDSFNANEITLLELVSSQIALAIANARLYSQTRELSIRDELTGLYNRRHFQDVVQVEWKRAVRFKRPLSVLMIDVDQFKQFNDSHGHMEGDRVLRQIADLLRRNLREVDTIARFGGEEFIALLPDTNGRGAVRVSEKLRHLMESERFVDAKTSEVRHVTMSIGISVYPDDVSTIDDLIDHADIALYDAKDSGRNRVVCYPSAALIPESPARFGLTQVS